MLVLIILFTTLIGSAATTDCYGLNRTNSIWEDLVKLSTVPLKDGQNTTFDCIYGTITTGKLAKCENGVVKLIFANGTMTQDYPSCTVGTVDCSTLLTNGEVKYSLDTNIPVDTTTVYHQNGIDTCSGNWAGSNFTFTADNCNVTLKNDTTAKTMTIENKLKFVMNESGGLHTHPDLGITTSCSMDLEKKTSVVAWQATDNLVKPAPGESTFDFTFDVLSAVASGSRIEVVIGEEIPFKIEWDANDDNGLKFYLKSLKARQIGGEKKNVSIVEDRCPAGDGAFAYTLKSLNTLSSTSLEFNLKAFSFDDTTNTEFALSGVQFDLDAVIELCNFCVEKPVSACPSLRRKRHVNELTTMQPKQEEVHLSTGPFVLKSKEQISGAKAVGWMLHLSMFSGLIFLQYL